MPKRIAAASKPAARGGKAKKTASGYKFPERIPSGFIIKDSKKQEWLLCDTIGAGGFGEIYSASDASDSSKASSTHPYAIKVEPKENGPLYVEMHFYMRVAKAEEIDSWKKNKNLKIFGMPVLYGSGSFEYNSNNYRFLVTDKLGKNLQDLLTENNKKFPQITVLQIGIQVLNLLEYIHTKGYIHGDIKAANLMLGLRSGSENTIYAIDFGLAAKCPISSKEYLNDPKKANNGTMEYVSRDGHRGVFGFRGDLEILGYNLLHWLHGSLPWEKDLAKPNVVEQKKIELMNNPKVYFKKHFPELSEEMITYMEYVGSLKNNSVPDYDHCKSIFINKLRQLKCTTPYGKLTFTSDAKSTKLSIVQKNDKVSSRVKLTRKAGSMDIASSDAQPAKQVSGGVKQNVRKRKSPIIVIDIDAPSNLENGVVSNISKNKKLIDNGVTSGADPVESVSGSDSVTESTTKSIGKKRLSMKCPKKRKPSIKGRRKNIKSKENIPSKISDLSESEHDVASGSSSVPSIPPAKIFKKTKALPKGKKTKANDENKPSWRDAPTIKAGGVTIAGEYTSTSGSSNVSKKSRKKVVSINDNSKSTSSQIKVDELSEDPGSDSDAESTTKKIAKKRRSSVKYPIKKKPSIKGKSKR